MVLGILLIASGILILLHPPLLAYVVASFLIFLGAVLLSATIHYRRRARRFEDPFLDVFFRF